MRHYWQLRRMRLSFKGGLLDRNPLNTEAAVGGGFGALIPGVGAVGAAGINRMRDPLTRAQRSFRCPSIGKIKQTCSRIGQLF